METYHPIAHHPLAVSAPVPPDCHWPSDTRRSAYVRTRKRIGYGLILIVSMYACLFRPAVAFPATSPNLLNNGDFMRGAEHWMLQADKPASAKSEMLAADSAPTGEQSRVLHINILTAGEHNWNIQLYQPGLDLTDDKPYTLTFWARADRERTLDLNMALDKPDWHTVGLAVAHVPLTQGWHKFVFVFTASRTAKTHNRLTFVLGETPGTVDLAKVSLQNVIPGTPSDPNLLESADFVDNLGDWSLQQSAPASAKLDWLDATAASSEAPGKVARLEVSALGEHNWNVQFQQSGLDLVNREPYTLSFWARADRERTLGVSMSLDMPDWHAVGLDHQTKIAPEWHKFTLIFTATQTVKDHSRLSFLLGDALGRVELAGVQLQHYAPNDEAPPAKFSASAGSRSLVGTWENRSEDPSRRFQLTFNADGTGSLHTGAAKPNAVPTAPVNAFRWYLKEGKARLFVGDRAFRWSVRSSGPSQILTLTDRKGKAHLYYRR